MLLIALLPSIVAATSILARPADGSAVVTLGTIDLDTPSFTSTSDFAGEACIGLNVAGDFVCHVLAQIEADKGKEFTIEAKDGVITKINFKRAFLPPKTRSLLPQPRQLPKQPSRSPCSWSTTRFSRTSPKRPSFRSTGCILCPFCCCCCWAEVLPRRESKPMSQTYDTPLLFPSYQRCPMACQYQSLRTSSF